MGDIHGEFLQSAFIINETNSIEGADIVQVGDFGMGFHKKGYYENILARLNEKLRKKDNRMFAFRGNHDDPEYFNGEWKYSNLELVPDYTVLELGDERILCIGGAVSVDRISRTEGRSWWKGEVAVLDEEKLRGMRGITGVATHTCPHFAPPHSKANIMGFLSYDEKLEDDISDERVMMTSMFNTITENNEPKYWVYGHFHGNPEMQHSAINLHGVDFKFCGIDELFNVDKYRDEKI